MGFPDRLMDTALWAVLGQPGNRVAVEQLPKSEPVSFCPVPMSDSTVKAMFWSVLLATRCLLF